MFAVGLSYMTFITLRYVPSMPAFWRIFIINGCWILLKAISASIEITIWFLSFNLLMWCITLIDLWILKNPCSPGIKPTWLWCMIFFDWATELNGRDTHMHSYLYFKTIAHPRVTLSTNRLTSICRLTGMSWNWGSDGVASVIHSQEPRHFPFIFI